MKPVKLSPIQQKVVDYMRHGWRAYIEGVSVVYINGRKVCNLDTMTALERKGLVFRTGRQWEWNAGDVVRGD
jgi:predicted metalloenzyme YecM